MTTSCGCWECGRCRLFSGSLNSTRRDDFFYAVMPTILEEPPTTSSFHGCGPVKVICGHYGLQYSEYDIMVYKVEQRTVRLRSYTNK